MSTFVLVHGAWHGGWCWREVAAGLRREGHDVHTPTLTGLGERSHLAHPYVTPETHVDDILGVIRWRELDGVILVGHSYGGLVTTAVADRVPQKLLGLVYIDAFVPDGSGDTLAHHTADSRLQSFARQAEEDGCGYMIRPDLYERWTDDPGKQAWLRRMCTPQPMRCFETGVRLSGRHREVAARLYLLAGRNEGSMFEPFYERFRTDPSWTTGTLPTLHDAMVERPDLVVRWLTKFAADCERTRSPAGS